MVNQHIASHEFHLTVQPDPHDPRDRPFPPDLSSGDQRHRTDSEERLAHEMKRNVQVPATPRSTKARPIECDDYRALADPAWRQRGAECTGFALAAIANYHLRKDLSPSGFRKLSDANREARTVSRRMLYEMAQVYDRADFEEGSTLRGALKGWNALGVAAESTWPYAPNDEHGEKHGSLTMPRLVDAVGRPGGYYLRVDHTNSSDMRNAIARGYPLFAAARTHVGWFDLYLPGRDTIEREAPGQSTLGAHAFVIYGYDHRGWLVHNSWGPEWGDEGFAVLPYDDWDANGQDLWFVFEPRQPRFVLDADPRPTKLPEDLLEDLPEDLYDDMWLHLVPIGDDGGLSQRGRFGMNAEETGTLLYLFRQQTADWSTRRLAIFTDGGYRDGHDTLAGLRPLRDQLMKEEIFPIFLVWDSPWYGDLLGWLFGEFAGEAGIDPAAFARAASSKSTSVDPPVGALPDALLKYLAAEFSATRIWGHVVDRSLTTCRSEHGAARILADRLAFNRTKAPFEIHLIGHGAGDQLLAELATILPSPITSCQLLGPTTTMDDFANTYAPMLDDGCLKHLQVIALADAADRADWTGPIPGSFLQLVSDVLAHRDIDLEQAIEHIDGAMRWTPKPIPLLGLERFVTKDERAQRLIDNDRMTVTTVKTGTHLGMPTDTSVVKPMIEGLNARPSRTVAGIEAGSHGRIDARTRDPLDVATSRDPLSWVFSAG